MYFYKKIGQNKIAYKTFLLNFSHSKLDYSYNHLQK
ncbi:hypothetical protein Fleli_1194 [Bernardetia litoralis DSM 6794]|uniref:Uncharacterized protein n=1 Tax=Bernardetia litoralis (strain ATCC 23117 / DSM 6794 / NBRC 15988 / NCIMB 1366 / Fx l1 / Sio-4) TaxID=880071 RepID=I4AI46_BERLS|nr:hypothetical protein Fleli_1194 [Bernardetia litoralis DSM 6794]